MKLAVLLLLSLSATGFGEDRNFKSDTIEVRLLPTATGVTTAFVDEKGPSTVAIIEAFYYTTINGQRLMLHKEAIAEPLSRISTSATDIPLDLKDIEFIRVKEMTADHETKFDLREETQP